MLSEVTASPRLPAISQRIHSIFKMKFKNSSALRCLRSNRNVSYPVWTQLPHMLCDRRQDARTHCSTPQAAQLGLPDALLARMPALPSPLNLDRPPPGWEFPSRCIFAALMTGTIK